NLRQGQYRRRGCVRHCVKCDPWGFPDHDDGSGIPGDSVMAVMIGSMIIWGIQPGPSLFVNRPALVVTITTIMVLATLVTLGINLVRMPMMVKLLDMPKHYIWATVLVFCIIGTYATTNN